MDGDKLQQLVKEHLSYDEYAIQKQEKVAYKGGDNIDGLQNVLFKSPHCKKEFSFAASNKNVLTCESCGYSKLLQNSYRSK